MPEIASLPLRSESNLQGYYKLEDANDFSTHSRILTNHGSTTFVAAKFGNGARITSSAQWLGNNDNMNITGGNMSMGGWFKMAAAPTSQQYNLCFQQSSTNNVANWIDYEYTGGTPRINFARFKGGVASQYSYYTV